MGFSEDVAARVSQARRSPLVFRPGTVSAIDTSGSFNLYTVEDRKMRALEAPTAYAVGDEVVWADLTEPFILGRLV